MLNVGLIGCGSIASWHIKIYKLIKDVKVIAVSDINLEKARAFAAKNKIRKHFNNYLDLLEIKDLDFVDVCTPTSTHASIIIDAVKSNHNVFTEKPLALSTQQCNKIISESRRHGVKVCVCHNQIFFPGVQKIKAMIDGGKIEPVVVKTFIKEDGELLPPWTKTASEGGIIWEVAYHLAYLQLFFLKNIKDVFAVGGKIKYPVYDDFCVLLRTSSDCYGIMEVSELSKKQEAFIEIDTLDGDRFQIDRVHDNILKSPVKVKDLAIIKAKLKFLPRKLRYFRGHYRLIKKFIDSIKFDLPSPVPPEDGRKTIQLLECIQKSLDEGKIIPFPE
jgi:myo-inositol 2-dehydrogenase/D-chiro-inositol 1-dehydrogenase